MKKQMDNTVKSRSLNLRLLSNLFIVTLLFSIGLSGEFKIKADTLTSIGKILNINNLFINSFYMGATSIGVSTLIDTFLSTTLGKITVAGIATATVIGGGIGINTLTTNSRNNLINQPVPQVIENRKDIKLTELRDQPIRGCVDVNNYFRVEFPQDISGWECDQNQTYNNKKALLLTKNNHKLYIVQGESTPGYGIDVNNAISNEILLNEFDEQTSKAFTLFKFPNAYLGGGHIYEGNNKIAINYILEGSDIVEDSIKTEIVKILLNITFVEIDLIRPIVTVSTTTTPTPSAITITPTPSSNTGLVVYNDSFFGDIKLEFKYDSNIWNISELVQSNNSKYINLQNKTSGRKFSIKYQNADYSFFTGNTDFYRGYLMSEIKRGEVSDSNQLDGYKLYKSGLVRVKTVGYPNFEQYRVMFDNVVPEWVYGYEYIVNQYKPEYGVKNWGTANFVIETTWSNGLGIPSGTIYLATAFIPIGENFSDTELSQVDEIIKTLRVFNINITPFSTFIDNPQYKLNFSYDKNQWTLFEVVQNVADNTKYIYLSLSNNGKTFIVKYQKSDLQMLLGNMNYFYGNQIHQLVTGTYRYTNENTDFYTDGLVKIKALREDVYQARSFFNDFVPEWLYGADYLIDSSSSRYGVKNWGTVGYTIETTNPNQPGGRTGFRYMATVFIPENQNFSNSELVLVDQIVRTMKVTNN